MRNIFGKETNDTKKKDLDINEEKVDDNIKLKLRGEEMDIAKSMVKVGDVEFGKEIIEEEKIVDVPVMHEEVVIERHSIGNEPIDSSIDPEESIHIPVSKEKIDVGKHTVLTGEVSAYKKEVVNNERVSEVLKREEARVSNNGESNIVSDTNDNHSF